MVPKVPAGARARDEQRAELETPAGPCLSAAPVGWAAFSSQKRAVWGRTLENGVYAIASHHGLVGESQGAAADAGTRGGTGRRAEEAAGPPLLGKAISTKYRRNWGLHK